MPSSNIVSVTASLTASTGVEPSDAIAPHVPRKYLLLLLQSSHIISLTVSIPLDFISKGN